jgi:hypothetical protein
LKSNYKYFLLITLIHSILSVALYYRYGVKVVNDSRYYLESVSKFAEEGYIDGHSFWYFTYILFIYVLYTFFENPAWLVLIQNILTLGSVLVIFQFSYHWFGNRKGALFTSLGYLLFLEQLTWSFYILTEAIYAPVLCFVFYGLWRLDKGISSSWYFKTLLFIALVFAFFIKPTGLALLIALGIAVFFRFRIWFSSYYHNLLTVWGSFIVLLLLANQMLSSFILVENFALGEIVYGVTTLPQLSSGPYLIVIPPKNLYIPDKLESPLWRLFTFIIFNPWFMCKLFWGKVFYFVSHFRPYWSLIHNLFIVLTLYPTYYFFIKGLSFKEVLIHQRAFILSFVVAHILFIGLTSVDWDGRFLAPLYPLIFLIGGQGFAQIFKK